MNESNSVLSISSPGVGSLFIILKVSNTVEIRNMKISNFLFIIIYLFLFLFTLFMKTFTSLIGKFNFVFFTLNSFDTICDIGVTLHHCSVLIVKLIKVVNRKQTSSDYKGVLRMVKD